MAVREDARGRGIGGELLAAVAAEAPESCTALALNVHMRNPAARLYMRSGFRVAGKDAAGMESRWFVHLIELADWLASAAAATVDEQQRRPTAFRPAGWPLTTSGCSCCADNPTDLRWTPLSSVRSGVLLS